MEALAWLAAAIAVGFLVLIVWSVARRGAGQFNLDLITKTPATGFLATGTGGLANAFAGTLVIVAIATAMALPTGILVALYLIEFAPPAVRNAVSIALDVLNGVPAIVIGIFVYGLFVLGHGQSAYAASFALACLMLPLVARSTMEVLLLVPNSLREASLALGVARWRTTLSIVLPQTIGGIVTGTVLAVARVAGETAPILFTSSLVGTALHWNPRSPPIPRITPARGPPPSCFCSSSCSPASPHGGSRREADGRSALLDDGGLRYVYYDPARSARRDPTTTATAT
jgi:phosphate transport system permease protein